MPKAKGKRTSKGLPFTFGGYSHHNYSAWCDRDMVFHHWALHSLMDSFLLQNEHTWSGVQEQLWLIITGGKDA